MAGTKISALPAVAAVAGTQEGAVNDSGTSKKFTVTQLATFLRSLSETLTNKTIDDANNIIQNLAVSALADGTDGELITWDATGAPATVSTGTDGQVLTSNGAGTAPTMQTIIETGDVYDQGNFDTSSTTYVDRTNMTLTLPNLGAAGKYLCTCYTLTAPRLNATGRANADNSRYQFVQNATAKRAQGFGYAWQYTTSLELNSGGGTLAGDANGETLKWQMKSSSAEVTRSYGQSSMSVLGISG